MYKNVKLFQKSKSKPEGIYGSCLIGSVNSLLSHVYNVGVPVFYYGLQSSLNS